MVKYIIKSLLHLDYQKSLLKLRKATIKQVGTLTARYMFDKEPIPFEERLTRETEPLKVHQTWSKAKYGCGYINFVGQVPQDCKGKHVALKIAVGGEGAVMDNNGTPIAGISSVMSTIDAFQPSLGKRIVEVSHNAEGGEKIDIWVETGDNKLTSLYIQRAKLQASEIVVIDDTIKELYYDYLHLVMFYVQLDKSDIKAISIKKVLRDVDKLIKDMSLDNIAKAREIIKAERESGTPDDLTMIATGHAHLDLAWLWPIRETKRKSARTFINQLNNIEKYDDYIFGVSQPQQLEWLAAKYPQLHEKVIEAIAKGRIEPQGGMWVECDTNITGGEALIRQNILGKRYWKENFGVDMPYCWLPDVFGFSGNLPQILQKCGMKYFLTIKLSWNEQNRFPHRTFIWEGIDNSSVLVHMPPQGDYNSDGTPWALKKAREEYLEKDKVKVASLPFGVGDGGGGPSEGHIEMVKRSACTAGLPKVKIGTQLEMFRELDKYKEFLKKFKGELYLEKHQGTYTSQAKNKLYNRKSEILLHNVEYLYSLALVYGCPYPVVALEKLWKEICLYQFHDIIPGSSIKRVYTESVARYKEIVKELLTLEHQAIDYLASNSDLGDLESKAISYVNPIGFDREELIKKEEDWYVVKVNGYAASVASPFVPDDSLKFGDDFIENYKLKICFDKFGDIISMVDKDGGFDYAGEYLNRLVLYKDPKYNQYNAWDININYTKKAPTRMKLVTSKTFVDGASVIRESLYKFNRSTVTERAILKVNSPYIEFVTTVDWQETHKMLRIDSRPSVFSDEVTCDIQLGNLKRSTKDISSIEKAQFEISAHKYIDVSAEKLGFALINDCKYGYRVKEGLISFNLLRSTMFPDKNADKGAHTIKYAYYPHKDDIYTSGVIKHAYCFNNPLIPLDYKMSFDSMIESSAENIIIETVKKAFDSQDIVLRLYETFGKTTNASIKTKIPYTSVELVNMLEEDGKDINLDQLTFSPFEIKTIILKR